MRMTTRSALPLLLLPLLAGCFWRSSGGYTEVCNKGSDTMLEVAGAWAEAYDKITDHIVISVSGGGSGTGIANVIAGTIDLANSSRKLKKRELEAARARGQDPVEHIVGFDGIAIYVHKDNPIEAITMSQLNELFSTDGKITRWSELGVTMPADLDEVVLISRQNNSGTYEYFREAVLGKKGRFKLSCLNLNGSKDVVKQCSTSLNAIGYSGLAYATPEVRLVPIIESDEGGLPVTPCNDTILDRSYPISRPLYMYTNGTPSGATEEYLEWILSDAGQRVLKARGYSPVRKL